jgi:hypothetical protein
MKAIVAILWFVIASVGRLHAQVQLPDLYVYDYAMSQRDPFISADAPTTLLTNKQEIHGIVSGDIVKQYLDKVILLIKAELYVGGVSIGDRPFESMVLINGIGFHTGDKIPMEGTKKEIQGIKQLTASYGLPAATDEKGSLVLEVGRITESGVDLVLPGFKAAIYQLPLPRDVPPTGIQLEKKKRKPRTNN